MKGRMPYSFVFHGFFNDNSRNQVTKSHISNLFTSMPLSLYYNTGRDIITSATIQPLSSPFPYMVKPGISKFTFIETTDVKELKNMVPESNWFYVQDVIVLRVDSDASPLMGDIKVNWRDRVVATSDDGSTEFIFSPLDPWTRRRYDPRNVTTSVRGRSLDFLNKPMIQAGLFPVGSPQSTLDQNGMIVPESIPYDYKELRENYPGFTFLSISNTLRLTEEKSMKALLPGYRPYFLLSDHTSRGINRQARHNHYNTGARLQVIQEGLTNTLIPNENMQIGVTGGGNFGNYDTYDYNWMFSWQEPDENISLFKIKGTGLMRYQYELPFIQFESPGRWLDEYSLSRANVLVGLEKIRALNQIIETGKDFIQLAVGVFTGVYGIITIVKSSIDIISDLSDYKMDLMMREARKRDMDKVTSDQHLDTHYNKANSIVKTTNTYINMGLTYPQPSLVGGKDNNMFNDETRAEVTIPVNKLFKSLDDFTRYLKVNKLTDVANVIYRPFFDGNNEKWDLLKRYGFRRTQQRTITDGTKQVDQFKRVGSQSPGYDW